MITHSAKNTRQQKEQWVRCWGAGLAKFEKEVGRQYKRRGLHDGGGGGGIVLNKNPKKPKKIFFFYKSFCPDSNALPSKHRHLLISWLYWTTEKATFWIFKWNPQCLYSNYQIEARVAFNLETINIICRSNQMTDVYIKCNTKMIQFRNGKFLFLFCLSCYVFIK